MHKEEFTCPVCGMDARDSTIFTVHNDIEYYFCSAQCRENFGARPKLYIGKRGAKPATREVIKRRSFRLDRPVEGEMEHLLKDALHRMMGIRSVRISGRNISITYNLLQATADQLEQAMADAGAELGAGWSARLKHSWTHYTEENELDNLTSDDAACCNKPPAKG
ncbi:MAG: hypothetical protein R8L58_08190 [Mariprofundaceae bacterium]